jgi:hypothetical protein
MGKAIVKIIVGLIVGAGLWVGAMALDFPTIFRWMFFAYAILGTVVFLILDAPSLKPMSGTKALVALVAFYVVLCVVYIAGASLWPQYDPEDEKGKIEKILAPKRGAYQGVRRRSGSCGARGRRSRCASRDYRGGRRRHSQARRRPMATAGVLQLP